MGVDAPAGGGLAWTSSSRWSGRPRRNRDPVETTSYRQGGMVLGVRPSEGPCRTQGDPGGRSGRAPILACAVLIAAVACGGCTSEGDDDIGVRSTSTESTSDPASSITSELEPAGPDSVPATTPPFSPVSSDQWTAQSLETAENAAGRWEGTAMILNGSAETRDGNFVFILKRGADVVATLTGSATAVAGATTTTVSLTSVEGFTNGEYSVEFKATFGF